MRVTIHKQKPATENLHKKLCDPEPGSQGLGGLGQQMPQRT